MTCSSKDEIDLASVCPGRVASHDPFHLLLRCVVGKARLLCNARDDNLARVMKLWCWRLVEAFGIGAGDWQAELLEPDGSVFSVSHRDRRIGTVRWSLMGRHNVLNALGAVAAAAAHGADPVEMLPALGRFRSVSRRMEFLGSVDGIEVYDDFAHHPTAIATTLAGLRAKIGQQRILVAFEPRSNSMRQGVHAEAMAPSLAEADRIVLLQRPELAWNAAAVIDALDGRGEAVADVGTLLQRLLDQARQGDRVVFMSNGGFEAAPRRFVEALKAR